MLSSRMTANMILNKKADLIILVGFFNT